VSGKVFACRQITTEKNGGAGVSPAQSQAEACGYKKNYLFDRILV